MRVDFDGGMKFIQTRQYHFSLTRTIRKVKSVSNGVTKIDDAIENIPQQLPILEDP